MSEADTIDFSQPAPVTVKSMMRDLQGAGLGAGQTVLVHSSLSKLGWVAGGAVAVVQALMAVLTPDGTLMMPTHSAANTDPRYWRNPPVPESWWQVIRDETPAYDPAITPTREMGIIAETFRKFPGVHRSAHPSVSFAAWGKYAEALTVNHQLEAFLGEGSPLSRLYDLDGHVLLMGVGHGNNTSLHLAEYRAKLDNRRTERQGAAVFVDGERQWVEYDLVIDISDHDFDDLGADYERSIDYAPGRIGVAELRLLRQRPLIDYAVTWMERHRAKRP